MQKGEFTFRHLGNTDNPVVPWKGGERKHGFMWLWEKKRVTQKVPRVHVDHASWASEMGLFLYCGVRSLWSVG